MPSRAPAGGSPRVEGQLSGSLAEAQEQAPDPARAAMRDGSSTREAGSAPEPARAVVLDAGRAPRRRPVKPPHVPAAAWELRAARVGLPAVAWATVSPARQLPGPLPARRAAAAWELRAGRVGLPAAARATVSPARQLPGPLPARLAVAAWEFRAGRVGLPAAAQATVSPGRQLPGLVRAGLAASAPRALAGPVPAAPSLVAKPDEQSRRERPAWPGSLPSSATRHPAHRPIARRQHEPASSIHSRGNGPLRK